MTKTADETLDVPKFAETAYGKIRYSEIGPPDGEVVLFSTGGGAGYSSVYAFGWLADAGYRVISVNRPGYFDLPVDVVDTIEGHADIYHEVIQSLGISEKINVFGISMGGLSALYYAKKYPTASLILWSAVTGPYKVNEESANSPLGKLVLSRSGKRVISWLLIISARFFSERTIQEFLKTEADLDKLERRELAKQVVASPASKEEFMIFAKSLTPMNALYDGMMDEVKKATELGTVDWSDITCPTLVVHSTIDIDVPLDHAKRLAKMIPNIQMVYVRAGGHFVWWGDEGVDVKRASEQFLDLINRHKLT